MYTTHGSTETNANCTIVDTDYVTSHYTAESPNQTYKTVEFFTVEDENCAYQLLVNYDLGATGETVIYLCAVLGASEDGGLILQPDCIIRDIKKPYGPFNGNNKGILEIDEEETVLANVISEEFKEGDTARVVMQYTLTLGGDFDINGIEYVVNSGIFTIFVCNNNKAYIVNTDYQEGYQNLHCLVSHSEVLCREFKIGRVKEVIGCSEQNDIYILCNDNIIKYIEIPVARDYFKNK